MFGLFPWKLLNPNGPVNKPRSEWFNAVTRVLSTLGVKFSDGTEAYIDRPNTDGSFWNLVLPQACMTPDEYHFRCDKSDDNTVLIHAGRWSRRAGDAQTTVLMGVDGPATSGDYADVLTIGSITTSGFIQIELDDPISPTTITASKVDVYPTLDGQLTKRVVAKVTCAAGVITGLEQTAIGDVDDMVVVPDSTAAVPTQKSTGYNSAGELEIDGFAGAADGDCMMVYADAGINTTKFRLTDTPPADCSIAPANAGTVDAGLSRGDHSHHISDSDHATNADYATNSGHADDADRCSSCPWPGSIAHDDTTGAADSTIHDHGLLQGLADDDHSQYLLLAGGAGRDNQVHDAAATPQLSFDPATRKLADADEKKSIMYGDRQAFDDGEKLSVNWDGRTLSDSAPGTTLDWQQKYLYFSWTVSDGDFNVATADKIYKIHGVSGATITNWAEGGLVTGALSERHVKIIDADTEETVSGKILWIPD